MHEVNVTGQMVEELISFIGPFCTYTILAA